MAADPQGAHDVTVLSYSDASVGYGEEPVLRGVSFEVRPGRLVGLVGPNGVGKTTLLRVLSGAAKVTGGSVTLDGEDVSSMSPAAVARTVAVMPQSPQVSFAFSSREFVEMGRNPWLPRLSQLRAADIEAVQAALAATDTLRLADLRVDRLSGGDLQRLALAQALAQTPSVLLLDEPTSHLDLNHRLQVLDLVRRRADDGMAVLCVFHDLDMAARYADELVVLHSGTMRVSGTPEATLTSELLRDVFEVAAVVTTDPVTGAVSVVPVLRSSSVSSRRGVRVMLVCGSGSGAALMRKLVLEGYEVFAGALNAGDTDRAVAEVLRVEHIGLEPYTELSEAEEREVLRLAGGCDAVIVCPTPFGRGNLGVLRAAVRSGGPIVLVGTVSGRDFAGGEAAGLWAEATGRGAMVVGDWRAAAAALREVTGVAAGGDRRGAQR